MQCVYIVVLCAVAFSIHAANGLRCWSCTSSGDRHCGDPFNRTYFQLEDCDNNRSFHNYGQTSKAVCKKQKQIVNEQELVVRACVYDKERACPTFEHNSVKNVFCDTCGEDGCNAAQCVRPATMAALLTAILWAVAAKIF